MFYSANGTFTKKRSNKRIIEGMSDVESDNSHHHTHYHDELINKDSQLSVEINELNGEVSELEENVNQLSNNDATIVQQNNEMLTKIQELETTNQQLTEQVTSLQEQINAIQDNYIGHNDPITIRYPGLEFRRLENSNNNAKFLDGTRGNKQVLIIESCKQTSTGDNHQCVDVDV